MATFARTGPAKVSEYRAYIMGSDGHVLRRVDLFCADDDTAKERARALVDGHDVELWQLDRRTPNSSMTSKAAPVGGLSYS
jgi:hypothetical protein